MLHDDFGTLPDLAHDADHIVRRSPQRVTVLLAVLALVGLLGTVAAAAILP